MSKIAVIGAGLAGLVVARALNAQHDVSVFEKARGVGGRMSTRYADAFRFDHGAQFFTVKSRSFKEYLQPLIEAGVIAPWHARFAEITGATITHQRQWGDDFPHYVGVPNMNSIQKHLAADLTIMTSSEVQQCDWQDGRWQLRLAGGTSTEFDWLVVTVPLPQALGLLQGHVDLSWSQPMKACFAMMLGFNEEFAMQFDAARVLEADISWVSRNSSKPGRSTEPTVVVHATNAWADVNVDADIADVQRHLAAELKRTTGIDAASAEFFATHRWRYANIVKQTTRSCILDPSRHLGLCADWFIRGRVESAYTSAIALLEQLQALEI